MHFKGMEKVADLLIINLLFLLFSLPVFTIGASATAMHYCLRRWREGEGKIAKDFMKSFRLNFRQATILWCVFLILAAAVLNAFPVALAAVLPGIFLICSVLWLGLLCSASALGVQLLFAPVFDRIGK